MTNQKCESCRRAFFQSGGYMPCSCKAVVARKLTNEEKSDFRKKMEQDLIDNPLYSKRMRIESRPEYVEPPSLVPMYDHEFKILAPWYHPAFIWLSIGILLGILGCLYATSYLP